MICEYYIPVSRFVFFSIYTFEYVLYLFEYVLYIQAHFVYSNIFASFPDVKNPNRFSCKHEKREEKNYRLVEFFIREKSEREKEKSEREKK